MMIRSKDTHDREQNTNELSRDESYDSGADIEPHISLTETDDHFGSETSLETLTPALTIPPKDAYIRPKVEIFEMEETHKMTSPPERAISERSVGFDTHEFSQESWMNRLRRTHEALSQTADTENSPSHPGEPSLNKTTSRQDDLDVSREA